MSNSKISALTSATTPLAGTEVLPIVQSGATVKVASDDLTVRNIRANATTGILQVTGPGAGTTRVATVPNANWTAARTDAAQSFTGDQTLSTGNLIIGTSGKGIDFSVTSHPAGMTSELFADYEEGTFTPTVIGPTAGSATYSTQVGKYTKIGNVVNILIDLAWTGGTGSGGFLAVTGLPYTIGGSNTALAGYISDIALSANNIAIYLANVSSTTIYIQQIPVGGGSRSNINYDAAGSATISGTYFV